MRIQAPMAETRNELTRLLRSWSDGSDEAAGRLMQLVYRELRTLAHRQLRNEGRRTLDTTELVHEAYLRLVGSQSPWGGRAHFFSAAARAMRHILVERARSRNAQKRGGGQKAATLDEALCYADERAGEVLELDEALTRLTEVNQRAGRIVEMKCFVGMTSQEIGEVLGVSVPTVDRDWKTARAWLMRELSGDAR